MIASRSRAAPLSLKVATLRAASFGLFFRIRTAHLVGDAPVLCAPEPPAPAALAPEALAPLGCASPTENEIRVPFVVLAATLELAGAALSAALALPVPADCPALPAAGADDRDAPSEDTEIVCAPE
jgi:hypothetical protein